MLKITSEELKTITKYIHEISGMNFDESKKYLVETRLSEITEELHCTSYSDLYKKARADFSRRIERRIIDAISINETLFFRDNGPFQLLRQKILPDLIALRKKKFSYGKIPLRIWSSACSSGQEVYSLAMVLNEFILDKNSFSIKLLGTDISESVLAQAKSGKYNKFEIERGLDKEKRSRYFTLNGGFWEVREGLRAMAEFRAINLMQPLNGLGRFDIILCRNVAIYFTLEDRIKLFNQIANILEPDGFLIIGSTESLTGVCEKLIPKRYNNFLFYQLRQDD